MAFIGKGIKYEFVYNKIAQIKEEDIDVNTHDIDLNGNFTQLNYMYGLDNERRKMTEVKTVAGVVASTRTKYYSQNYEKEEILINGTTTNREVNYIFAPDGLVAIYEKVSDKLYFVSSDALGSINMIVDETTGNIESDMSYDAWGRRRNAQDWSYNNISISSITDRGYTMHEMLDKFDLINMNGRAYDPLVGQFLSADPFVQDPANPQSYNRYAYCLNNPLKYTDPSGYMSSSMWSYWLFNHPGGTREQFLQENRQEWALSMAYDFFGGNVGSWGATQANGQKVDFEQMLKDTWSLYHYNHQPSFGGSAKYPVLNDGPDDDVWPPIWLYATWLEGPTIKANANSASSSNPAQIINKVTNDVGIIIDAAEQTVQNTKVGANIAYAISGNSKVVSSVSNTFKLAPYVGLAVTVVTGSYLSKTIDPTTNRPYQSWTETGTDIGANIVIIYLGTQFGGWYGAGAAVLYIGLKCALENPYEYYLPNGEINPGVQFIMNKE